MPRLVRGPAVASCSVLSRREATPSCGEPGLLPEGHGGSAGHQRWFARWDPLVSTCHAGSVWPALVRGTGPRGTGGQGCRATVPCWSPSSGGRCPRVLSVVTCADVWEAQCGRGGAGQGRLRQGLPWRESHGVPGHWDSCLGQTAWAPPGSAPPPRRPRRKLPPPLTSVPTGPSPQRAVLCASGEYFPNPVLVGPLPALPHAASPSRNFSVLGPLRGIARSPLLPPRGCAAALGGQDAGCSQRPRGRPLSPSPGAAPPPGLTAPGAGEETPPVLN